MHDHLRIRSQMPTYEIAPTRRSPTLTPSDLEKGRTILVARDSRCDETHQMNVWGELEDFVHTHRPHGPLTGDAAEPAWNGYLLTVGCPCGTVFTRWITPLDAELDLLRAASLN